MYVHVHVHVSVLMLMYTCTCTLGFENRERTYRNFPEALLHWKFALEIVSTVDVYLVLLSLWYN